MTLSKCYSVRKIIRLFTLWCSSVGQNLYVTFVKQFPHLEGKTWRVPISYGVIICGKVYLPNISQQGVVHYDIESGMSSIFLKFPLSKHGKYSEILFYDSETNLHFLKNVQILSSTHLQGIIPEANFTAKNVFLYGSEYSSVKHPFYITTRSYQKYDPPW